MSHRESQVTRTRAEEEGISRAAGVESLAQFLQGRFDELSATLADELHDSLGGLLAAAKMDLGLIGSKLGADTPELRATLGRLQEKLDGAIGVERRMVEQLRPGLLVHIGLFAALRWCVDDLRARTGHACRLCAPSEEVALALSQRVSLYRVARDALTLREDRDEYPQELAVDVHGNTLRVEVTHRGDRPVMKQQEELRLLDIRYRVGAMNGTLAMPPDDAGLLRLVIRVPTSAGGPGAHEM